MPHKKSPRQRRTWTEDPFKRTRSPFPRKPTQVHDRGKKAERRQIRDNLKKGVWEI